LAIVGYDWAIGKLDINALSFMKQALEYNSKHEVIIMSVLGLFAFALFYWTLYRIGPILFIGNAILNILISIIWNHKLVMPRVYDALAVILPLCVLGTYYVARRQNLITKKTLVFSACAFPVVVISLFTFPWSDVLGFSVDLSNPNHIQIIYLISAGFVPFIPVVATPLIMNKLRHR
jgi:hypothetical protein